MTDTQDAIAQAAVRLLLLEPFYAHLLGMVTRRVGTHTPTAGVSFASGRWTLHVNPTFFDALAVEERAAVLKHELLHILLQHVTRRDPHHHDALLHNIAADVVVNQLVGRWPLPAGAMTLRRLQPYGLLPDETLEVTYRKLQNGAKAVAKRFAGVWHSDHSGWSGEDGPAADLAEAEVGRLVQAVKDKAGFKSWGTLPAALRVELETLLARHAPRADWRRALRVFAASARHSGVTDTMREPSRRYRTFPGGRVRRGSDLLVALDTSGSIDEETLRVFFEELRHIRRMGAAIDVVECDAGVQRVYPWRGTVPGPVQGRGGTAFDPVFTWLRSGHARRYDGCVYLTDGFATEPRVKPPCRLLWALTPAGSEHTLRFGPFIRLSET